MIGTLGVLALALILCGLGLWMDYANRKSMEPEDEKRKTQKWGRIKKNRPLNLPAFCTCQRAATDRRATYDPTRPCN